MNAPAFVLAATGNVRAVLTSRPFLSARPVPVTSRFALASRRAVLPRFWACAPSESTGGAEAVDAEATPTEEPVAATTEEPVAAATEEPVAATTEEPVAATTDEPVAAADPTPETADAPDAVAETEPAAVEPIAAEDDSSVAVPAVAVSPEAVEATTPAEAVVEDAEPTEKRKRRRTRVKKEVTLPLEDMTVGMELEGTVKSVMDYGAFVGEMGTPTDGLLHVSQLAAGFVENVTDIVNVGDKLTVRVLAVDTAKGNFSLTMKTAEELAERGSSKGSRQGGGSRRDDQNKKWDDFKFDPEVFLDAKVVSVADFGGFCQLIGEDGGPLESAPTDGLIHISELSEERVTNVADVLKVGQLVKVRVTSTDRKRNRISMSLKPFSEGQDTEGNIAEDLAGAASNQPSHKTSFELAFERAKAPSKQ